MHIEFILYLGIINIATQKTPPKSVFQSATRIGRPSEPYSQSCQIMSLERNMWYDKIRLNCFKIKSKKTCFDKQKICNFRFYSFHIPMFTFHFYTHTHTFSHFFALIHALTHTRTHSHTLTLTHTRSHTLTLTQNFHLSSPWNIYLEFDKFHPSGDLLQIDRKRDLFDKLFCYL